jgi:hypothetical protein
MRWQVKSLSPCHRFVIALRSPRGFAETGLRNCPREKKPGRTCLQGYVGHFLQSGLGTGIRKLRRFRAILRPMQGVFSASQTVWRRERDSNPRYPFRYSGFQDVPSSAAFTRIQPCTVMQKLLSRAQIPSFGICCAPLCAPGFPSSSRVGPIPEPAKEGSRSQAGGVL